VCVRIPIHSPFTPNATFLLPASGRQQNVGTNIKKQTEKKKKKSATQTKHIGHKFFKEDVQNHAWSSIHTYCDKSSGFKGKKSSTMST